MLYHLYFGMAPEPWRKANESVSPERVVDNRIALCGTALRQQLAFYYRSPPDQEHLLICPDCAAANVGLLLSGDIPVTCPACHGTGLRAVALPPAVSTSCQMCMNKRWFPMRDSMSHAPWP